MNNELVRYATGEVKPLKQDRAMAVKAKKVYDEVRITGLKVDGAIALAGHVMEKVSELDAQRRALAGDDPVTNQILVDIELHAMAQVKSIQNSLYKPNWNL